MNKLVSAIYPNLCIFCEAKLQEDFCAACYEKYKVSNQDELAIATALRYEEDVKNAVWQFKFRSNFFAARQLSEYMKIAVCDKFKDIDFDCVSYVPLTKKKERSRGYNHAKILAEALAKKLSLECKVTLKKVLETKDQHDLSLKDRVANLNGAFEAVLNTEGMKILLVDDVLTSGNTIKECTKVLCQNESCNVYSVVAAKVLEK